MYNFGLHNVSWTGTEPAAISPCTACLADSSWNTWQHTVYSLVECDGILDLDSDPPNFTENKTGFYKY